MSFPNVNLLSPEKRHHVRHMGTLQFFKSILEIGLVMLSIVSMILVGGWWILQQHFRDLTAQLATVADTYAKSNQRIHEINVVIQQAGDLQDRYRLWTPLVTELANTLPDGVSLSQLVVNAGNNSVGFVGVADTRDDLLLFETEIESLSFVGEISIPLSQLAEKEHISFSLLAPLEFDTKQSKK